MNIVTYADGVDPHPPGPVVYYLTSAHGGAIKIGTAARLAERMATLARRFEWPMHILATEPGGDVVEAERHRQFRASYCIGEWHMPTPALMAHIAGLVTA